MLRRSACLGLAVAATLAGARMARAEDKSVMQIIQQQPIYAADEAAAAEKPLMAGLDKVGAGPSMKSAGLNITGFVEGGWTYNFDTPDNQINVGRIFDFEDQDKTLDQIDLTIERTLDATKSFDWGFKVEWIYGGDARLIHANGLNFYGDGNADVGGMPRHDSGDEQFDLVQCYAQVLVSGFQITAGKFVTLAGYETINPTTNPFYSHSYAFGFAIPFTQTGGMAKYSLSKDAALTLGFSRGWEQSPEDNNGSIDGFGQLAWTINDKTNVAVTILCGPETADDSSHYRTVVDVVGTYQVADNTKVGLGADYGYGSDQALDGGTGDWWGAVVYFSQTLDPHATFNVRAEYFNDEDGCRGLNSACTELTLGLTLKPCPGNAWASGLMIRPEIRWDHSNEDIFNDSDDDNQFTMGGDIIFAF